MPILLNLENLRIILFWQILKSNKFELLDSEYNPRNSYSNEQMVYLETHWLKLYDEFFDLRKDKGSKYLIKKNLDLLKMSFIIELLYDIENRIILLLQINTDFLEEFKEKRRREAILDFNNLYPKIKINIFDSLDIALEKIQSVIKSQTNIYEEKLGVKEKTIEKEEKNIQYIIGVMSSNLTYNLDSNNLMCLDFIAQEDIIKNKKANQNIK